MKPRMRLEPKVKNRTRVQTTLRYGVAGLALAVLISVGLFIYFNLGQDKESLAQNGSGSYDTPAEAYWLTSLFNYTSDNAGFTNSGSTSDVEQGSCFGGSTQHGVWLKFKALYDSASISIKTGGAEGTISNLEVALLDNGLSEIDCGTETGSNDITLSSSGLTANNWYYILINNAAAGSEGTFTVSINNVSPTAYYVRSSGNWDNPGTWSTTGFNGSSAGSIPTMANVVYLQNIQNDLVVDDSQSCAAIVFTGGNYKSVLKINNGAGLSVFGPLNWTGGDKEMEIDINAGDLYVQDNFIYQRSSGSKDHKITVQYGSVTVEGDLEISRIGGSAFTLDFDNATLTVGGNMTTTMDGGTNTVELSFDNNCSLDIGGDWVFEYLSSSGNLTVDATASTNITIGKNLNLTKSGGSGVISFTLEDGVTASVSGDVDFSYSSGSGNMDINIKSQSSLTTIGDLSANYTGGSGALTFDIGANASNYAGTLNVGGDFNFGTAVANQLSISVGKNSEVQVDGDISLLQAYGSLDFFDNSATLRLSGSVQQHIAGESATGSLMIDYRKLIVENTYPNDTIDGAIILDGPVTLESGLNLINGIIWTTSTNILTLKDGVTALGASQASFVHGPMIKEGDDDFTFPIGKYSIYASITISNYSNSSPNNAFEAEYFNTAYSNTSSTSSLLDHVSTMEYWDLERINLNALVQVAIHWENGERSGISDLTDLALAHWNSTQWTPLLPTTPSGSATTGSLETDDRQDNFGQFTFGSFGGINLLPVELVSFEARPVNSTSELTWETASESNCDYFDVQRSADGINFISIGRVQGAGTSNVRRTYQFIDEAPSARVNYYRLKQVDLNGMSQMLPIRQVKFDQTEATASLALQSVAPNPFKGPATVSYYCDSDKPVWLEVYNLNGQLMERLELPAGEGKQVYRYQEKQPLNPGVFLFVLQQGVARSETKKVIRAE